MMLLRLPRDGRLKPLPAVPPPQEPGVPSLMTGTGLPPPLATRAKIALRPDPETNEGLAAVPVASPKGLKPTPHPVEVLGVIDVPTPVLSALGAGEDAAAKDNVANLLSARM
jgi:hypothetical protein